MLRGGSRRPRTLTNTARRSAADGPGHLVPEPKIAPQRRHRPRSDGHDPLLPPLAAHLGLVRQQVERRPGSARPARRVASRSSRTARAWPGPGPRETRPGRPAPRPRRRARRSSRDRGRSAGACRACGTRAPRAPARRQAVMRLQIAIEAAHRGERARRRPLRQPPALQLAEEAPESGPVDRVPAPLARRSAGRRTCRTPRGRGRTPLRCEASGSSPSPGRGGTPRHRDGRRDSRVCVTARPPSSRSPPSARSSEQLLSSGPSSPARSSSGSSSPKFAFIGWKCRGSASAR